MDSRKLMWIMALVGSAVGGYVPTLWGAPVFSLTSIFFSSVGAIAGVWFVFKMSGY